MTFYSTEVAVEFAKGTLAGRDNGATKKDFHEAIAERAKFLKRVGDTPEMAYSRALMTDPAAQTLYKALKVAPGACDHEIGATVRKAKAQTTRRRTTVRQERSCTERPSSTSRRIPSTASIRSRGSRCATRKRSPARTRPLRRRIPSLETPPSWKSLLRLIASRTPPPDLIFRFAARC